MAEIFDDSFMQGPMDEQGLLRLTGSIDAGGSPPRGNYQEI